MRRSLPVLVVVIGLLALWGCSKKSPTQNTGDLSSTQESVFASEAKTNAVRVTGFVGSFSGSSGLGSTPDTVKPFGGPAFLPSLPLFGPDTVPRNLGWTGPMLNPHQPSTPPEWYRNIWSWNDTLGWIHDTVYVKFIPNIWDTGQRRQDTVKVTRVDWQGLIYWTSRDGATSSSLDESAYVGYSNNGQDTTRTDGSIKVVGSVRTGSTIVASYTYNFGWTNCTRTGWTWRWNPRTCSGSITWDARSSYLAVPYDLKGSYTFVSGTGDGEAQYKNPLTGSFVTFAKFHFNNNGTGYYTRLSENWQIQHPFFW